MKNILLLALLCLASCEPAHAFGHKQPPIIQPSPSPTPLVTASPSPSPTPSVMPSAQPSPQAMINVGTITGATDVEIPMIKAGVALANKMLGTKCFKQWILAASYTENNGLTQAQIYNLVTTKPTYIDIEMYTGTWWANHKDRTVGYENDPFDGVVHMNRYFVNSAYMVGDNVIHEDRGHSLEFRHDFAFDTSQPYGENYAYEGCSQAQQQQARGGRRFKPPGIRIEIRHSKKNLRKKTHAHIESYRDLSNRYYSTNRHSYLNINIA